MEYGRIWRRGSAPLPAEADSVVEAAVEAGVETTAVARAGYQAAPAQENALFNLFASFLISLLASRGIAFLLRDRRRVGPFRNVRVGRRHIHHFVPGIALAFVTGAIAIVVHNEQLEPKLALLFGAGMGLTMDEAALLLELDDVYWTEDGVLSVQLGASLVALLGALAIGLRFVRRGEERVLIAPAG